MPATATAAPPICILIVEDDETFADYLRRCLAVAGINAHCDTAASLADALSALAQKAYDAVLLDLRLPNGQGVDTVREILRAPSVPPPLVITGGYSETDAEGVLRAGAQDYIDKSVLSKGGPVVGGRILGRSLKAAIHRRAGVNEQFLQLFRLMGRDGG